MKYKIDQMSSQNIKHILHSARKAKANIPSRKSKNNKTPTVTIEIHNNLNYGIYKIDHEMICFAKR